MPVTTNTRKLAALLGASGAGIATDGTLTSTAIGEVIVAGDIAAGAVDTAELAAGAVTDAKLDLTTPALGTPTSGVVTNLSGVLPVGVTGGSGLTALASNPTVTLGSNTTWPTGHIRQTVIGNYYGSNSLGIASTAYTKTKHSGGSYNWQSTITDVLASSKVVMHLSFICYAHRDSTIESGFGFGICRDAASPASDTSGTLVAITGTSANFWHHNQASSGTGHLARGDIVSFTCWDNAPDTGTNIYYLVQVSASASLTMSVQSVNTLSYTNIMQEVIV